MTNIKRHHLSQLKCCSLRNQREITWILINVAFGTSEQSFSIVEAGGVPMLIRLMKSADSLVANHSAWCLSNMCGEGSLNRDMIIGWGVVPVLVELLMKSITSELELVRTLVWLSLNLVRFSTVPQELIEPLLQPLLNLFTAIGDRKVLVDACWFFTNLLNRSRDIPRTDVRNILLHLSLLLDQTNVYVLEAALICAHAIINKSSTRYDEILPPQIVPKIIALMFNSKFSVSRWAAKCCSAVAFRSVANVQILLNSNIGVHLSRLFEGENLSWKSKREGIWLLKNVLLRGSYMQMTELMDSPGLIKAVSHLLKTSQLELLKALLVLLVEYFEEDPTTSDFSDEFRLAELDSNLESLLNHVDDLVHDSARRLLAMLFSEKVFQLTK